MKFVNITGKWWLPILEEKQRLSLENFVILTLRKTVLKLNLWLSTVHVISNKSSKIQSSSFLTVFHQNSKICTITLLQINDTACTHPSSHPSNQDRKMPLKDHQPKQKGSHSSLPWGSLTLQNGCEVKSFTRVQPFATPRTVAYQAPQSTEFFRHAYWSGLPKSYINVKLYTNCILISVT